MLLEWTSIYINHINSFKQNLLKTEVYENMIKCVYKEGLHTYLIQETLKHDIIPKTKTGSITLVCLNSKDNLKFMIKYWNQLQTPQLKIMFVNPLLNLNWSIKPFIHNKIADRHNLKFGLNSLFESVPEV